jgi:small subunit ribosomal protein S20
MEWSVESVERGPHCTFDWATATVPAAARVLSPRSDLSSHPVEFHMANNNSQKKRNRQNEKRSQNNKSLLSDLKTSIKKVETAVAAGEPTDMLCRDAQKKIDVAAEKGVIHANAAARKKSRLAILTTVE